MTLRGISLTLISLFFPLALAACEAPDLEVTDESEQAVIGGTVDNAGQFANVGAAVIDPWPSIYRENTVCSGTLIHPEWVLTAGHCNFSECQWGTGVLKERCKWYFGYTDVQTAPVLEGRGVMEAYTFFPSTYFPGVPCQNGYSTCQNDIMLMKIYPPVTNVAPRKLASLTDFGYLTDYTYVNHVGYGCNNVQGSGRGYRRKGSAMYSAMPPIWPYWLIGPGTLSTMAPVRLCTADSGGAMMSNYTERLLGVPFAIVQGDLGQWVNVSINLRPFLMWIHSKVSLPCDSGRGCNDRCGDGVCDAANGETSATCHYDCGGCGNGVCEFPRENASNCTSDCASTCGNMVCDAGESGWALQLCPIDCELDTADGSYLYTCGDGSCTGDENHLNCAQECSPPLCGNGTCDPSETPASCASDCAGCGDQICDSSIGENDVNCPVDCVICGDGMCSIGETCQLDCMGCTSWYCGDGCCGGGEDFWSCPADC